MLGNLKESLQALLAVAALAAVFWGVRHYSRAELRASLEDDASASEGSEFARPREPSPQSTQRPSGPRSAHIPSRLLNLPVCADLADALRRLQSASGQLQEDSGPPDDRRTAPAREAYHQAVVDVRAELQVLYSLVAPEQYEELRTHVIERALPDVPSRVAVWRAVNPDQEVSL